MVQLLQDVYPYLLAFYLIDSVIWVRSGQMAFVSLSAGRFLLQRSGLSLRALRPTAEVLLTGAPRIAFDDRRLVLGQPARPRGAAPREADEWSELPYESVKRVAAQGRRLRLNGGIEILTPSAGSARHFARVIEELRRAGPGARRERVAARRAAALDLQAFRDARRRHAPAVTRLRAWAVVAAILFLGAIPACLYSPQGHYRILEIVVLPALLLVHAAVVWESVRLLRGAGFGWGEAVESLAPLLLFPPASVHAPSLVLRDLYAGFAPQTMAAVLLDPDALAEHAARERAGLARQDGSAAGAGELSRRQAEDAWSCVLAARGGERLPAPRRTDPTAAAYCPLCRAEYRAGYDSCRDCNEPLRSFDQV